MCSIYVINVGANTSHSSQARSPIFLGKSFQFVSLCTKRDVDNPTDYAEEMLPFTSPHKDDLKTHNDPDWKELTYGDDCSLLRARALKNVVPGDILLFWGLLWCNRNADWRKCIGEKGACWSTFLRSLDNGKGWYLFGAMRVKKVVADKGTLGCLYTEERCRIKKNAHFEDNGIPANHRVFLGDTDKKYSRLFDKAVELWVPKSESKWKNSLLYKTFRSSDRKSLSLNGSPRWFSSLRPCRKMWDLSGFNQHELAECVRDAIREDNEDFGLLENAHC